jgi:cytoskeletal protein CcmA (bactofilin family)
MARERQNGPAPLDGVISIIGPGMTVVGDLETQGTVRIEGRVEGTVRAGKAVVVGKDGSVEGTVLTQDAVISGSIVGSIVAESRLEVQASARIEGEVRALRMQLEDGAELNGQLAVGAPAFEAAPDAEPDAARRALRGEDGLPPRAAAS